MLVAIYKTHTYLKSGQDEESIDNLPPPGHVCDNCDFDPFSIEVIAESFDELYHSLDHLKVDFEKAKDIYVGH